MRRRRIVKERFIFRFLAVRSGIFEILQYRIVFRLCMRKVKCGNTVGNSTGAYTAGRSGDSFKPGAAARIVAGSIHGQRTVHPSLRRFPPIIVWGKDGRRIVEKVEFQSVGKKGRRRIRNRFFFGSSRIPSRRLLRNDGKHRRRGVPQTV